jgi:hypothetical protein
MLGRLKFEISDLVNQVLDQLPKEVWSSSVTTFLDPSMGGGQFVRAIESRLRKYGHSDSNIANRVFGYESNVMRVRFAVNKYKLIGTYVAKDLVKEPTNMQFDVVIGNPPYTDGTAGKSNIWQKFVTSKVAESSDYCCWVLPSSFMQTNQNPMPDVRKFLKAQGMKSIKILGLNAFESASVRTIYVYCEKGYTGKTKVTDKTESYEIEFDGNPVVFGGSETGTRLIQRIQTNEKYRLKKTKDTPLAKKVSSYSQLSGDVQFLENLSSSNINGKIGYVNTNEKLDYSDCDKIRLVLGYLPSGTNFAKSFGTMNIIMPGVIVPSYYRYFTCETVEEANLLKNYLESKLVTFIQQHARTSQTLDNPQIHFVPVINNLTQDHYSYFNLTTDEIDYIEANS